MRKSCKTCSYYTPEGVCGFDGLDIRTSCSLYEPKIDGKGEIMTGETVWVPHYRIKGEKPCEGCNHLESGLVEDDDGRLCLIHICPVNNLVMHYPNRVARCPDWVQPQHR